MLPLSFYLWIKALHIISVIAWMAGMLYLPRLFVYHCEAPRGSAQSETFKTMEARLYRMIMTPAMISTWLFGLLLLSYQDLSHYWIYAKLLLVVAMSAVHGMMGEWRRAFADDRNRRPKRFFRIANEVPTLLIIGIVLLVTVQPF